MIRLGLIAAGAAVALWAAFGGGRRKLGKGDLPKLAALQKVKSAIQRDVKLCAAKAAEAERNTSPTQVIGYAAGLFTGAATLNFKLALDVATNVDKGLTAVIGLPDACKAERARLGELVAKNTQLSAELGLDPRLTPEEIGKLVGDVNPVVYDGKGGATGGFMDIHQAGRVTAYANCVKARGRDACDELLDYDAAGVYEPGKAPRTGTGP